MTGHTSCYGSPTKVTFTFNDKCLRDTHHNTSPSFWDTHPYSEAAAYNMQKWMSQKLKSQKEKVKIERAVRRAEKKLQEEYSKQMEMKKAAAQKQFKLWLKSKGFADQSPVLLHRGAHYCEPPNGTICPGGGPEHEQIGRPTARSKSARGSSEGRKSGSQRNLQRPKSASNVINNQRSRSAEGRRSKSLCPDDYMKMRHIAGKRYKKSKEERTEFLCEDALLRRLQNLEWEEKCIKTKVMDDEKDDLGKIRSRALSRRRKKKGLKFKGDVITVEVEDINPKNVEITFHEEEDQCSDIGCIEKEGIDFHIESRETIDFTASDKLMQRSGSDTLENLPCRPKSARPRRSTNEDLTTNKEQIPQVVITSDSDVTGTKSAPVASPAEATAVQRAPLATTPETASNVSSATKPVSTAANPVEEPEPAAKTSVPAPEHAAKPAVPAPEAEVKPAVPAPEPAVAPIHEPAVTQSSVPNPSTPTQDVLKADDESKESTAEKDDFFD